MERTPSFARAFIKPGEAGASSLQRSPKRASSRNRAKVEERKWQTLFEDPSMWSDNRATKKNLQDPDFVHVFTWEGLWINSCSCPGWVHVKLQHPDRLPSQHVESLKHESSSEETIAEFDRTVRRGLKPSTSVILRALKSCSSLKDMTSGTRIQRYIEQRFQYDKQAGTTRDGFLLVSTALIDMYAKCGSLVNAQAVFDQILDYRDVVSWNTLIRAYSQGGEPLQALELFQRMQENGLSPDARTFVAALGACGSAGAKRKDGAQTSYYLDKGRDIHRQLLDLNLGGDLFVVTAIVGMYSKFASMVDAREVFESSRARGGGDVVLWTAIILGYAQSGQGKEALKLFYSMLEHGVQPNGRTYVAALVACGSLGPEWLEEGKRIHSQLLNGGFAKDGFVSSCLVGMYSKCGCMEAARQVFEGMKHKDVVTWTSLIQGYVQVGQDELSLELFRTMEQEHGLKPNLKTLVAALCACSCMAEREEAQVIGGRSVKLRSLETGLYMHSRARRLMKEEDEEDIYVGSALVDMYAKCRSMEDACRVFEGMNLHDAVSFTVLITGYAQAEDTARLALETFERMKREGLSPNSSTYAAVLKACGLLVALETGRVIHAQACADGFIKDSTVICAAVDFFGKCGCMEDAQRVFHNGLAANKISDLATFSALIAGYSHQGNSEQVFYWFDKMIGKDNNLQPDGVTFVSVLSACNHAGLVDRGKQYFHRMKSEFRIAPGPEHYLCMVDMLGRANHIAEALDVVRGMPFKPGYRIWMSLLDACRRWKNSGVARLAFNELVSLDRQGGGAAYVLMAEACEFDAVHLGEKNNGY